MLFDIHSHILPDIDDGAKNLNESLKILKMMQQQGITDVIATPHFYPEIDNLEEFQQNAALAFKTLREFSVKRNLPNIYLGCELLYYSGISNSEDLSYFCLNGSSYLLLELTDNNINDNLFNDILIMKEKFHITPIIAHIERYSGAKRYKKLVKFLIKEKIPIQINASSVLIPAFDRTVKKLLDSELECYIATDSHSTDLRPPYMAQAIEYISSEYGTRYRSKLTANSEKLYRKIVTGGE